MDARIDVQRRFLWMVLTLVLDCECKDDADGPLQDGDTNAGRELHDLWRKLRKEAAVKGWDYYEDLSEISEY